MMLGRQNPSLPPSPVPVTSPHLGPGPIRAYSSPTIAFLTSSTPGTPMAYHQPLLPPSPLTRSGSVPVDAPQLSEDADSLPPLRSPRIGATRDIGNSFGVEEQRGMSRSVSDCTLRQAASRAALHLPLPVTSLMHFKVCTR